MKSGPDIARVAALIGDPGRANMLIALMCGKALTASELAAQAGVTPQTASSHLARLVNGGLLRLRRQGRHRYFAIASPEVAEVLEAMMGLAADAGHLRSRTGPKDKALRKARLCYNHLAGAMGVQLFESLLRRRRLELDGAHLRLTEAGQDFARAFGIDVDALTGKRSVLCRECLDWSERRSHLAGSLGRALFDRIVELGWARMDRSTRVVEFTPSGARSFRDLFDLDDRDQASTD